jgi:hypothetical protein
MSSFVSIAVFVVIGSPIIRFWLNAFFLGDVNYLAVLELEGQGAPEAGAAKGVDQSED